MRHVRADELPPGAPDDDLVVEGENLTALARLPDELFDVVYIDPPFNTGRTAAPPRTIAVRRDDDGGDRTGFGGRRYRTELVCRHGLRRHATTTTSPSSSRASSEAHRVLAPHGTLYFHIDYREVHYCKVLLDRHLRPRVLPQRDHLGLRLRRAHDAALAGQARHHPRLRQGPGRLPLRHRRGRPQPVHGARARRRRRRRRAASSRPTCWWHTIVPTNGTEKHRLPDPEARGHRCGGSSPRRRARAAGASTSSPARARSGRCAAGWGAGTCWSTRIPRPWRSCCGGSGRLRGDRPPRRLAWAR